MKPDRCDATRYDLYADENDAPARRQRRPVGTSGAIRNAFLVIATFACGIYFSWSHFNAHQAQPQPFSEHPRTSPLPQQLVEPHAEESATTGQPLADCIKTGNLIDEAVVRCRFGHHPKPRESPSAEGMVSAAYLAQFKAERRETEKRHEQFMESHTIRGWDGKGWYIARWQVVDNWIDSTSVCANYRRGSIEFRECRKGAKVWLKEQCRSGTNQDALQRYCSAASGFNPMG